MPLQVAGNLQTVKYLNYYRYSNIYVILRIVERVVELEEGIHGKGVFLSLL
jgi:hypothetical protein